MNAETGRLNAGQDSRPPQALDVDAAVACILAAEHPLPTRERVAIDQALGRVLAESLSSPLDQPAWDQSAMDGYALCHADLRRDPPCWQVSQRVAAGCAPAPLAPGTAARIFTGACLPAGADTVVVQEVCARDGQLLRIAATEVAGIRLGANVRKQGEDVRVGDRILDAGTRLRPQHLALAAAVGLGEVPVYRRLRVAILSSGDELLLPGEAPRLGRIYNSNRFMLAGLVRALGCEVRDLGMIPDSLEPTLNALRQAAEQADLVVVSGGVSVGEEDHVRPALQRLGRIDVGAVAMRPGKPVVVGRIGRAAFVGCPGNPVSLFVTFALFARPLILTLQGCTGDLLPRARPAIADFSTAKADKRREYQRARLVRGEDGRDRVRVFPSRSSAAIQSLTWADGLVVIPEHRRISPGDRVDFLAFSDLLA